MSVTSLSPKCVVTIPNVGSGKELEKATLITNATLRHRTGALQASLGFSDASLREYRTLKDIALTADYALPNTGVTINAKHDAFFKLTTLGATTAFGVAGRNLGLRFWANNKDRLVHGEFKVLLDKATSGFLLFNQRSLLAARYVIARGPYVWEPSYSFVKETPLLSVSRRRGADLFRGAFDFKSQEAVVEWGRWPFTLALATRFDPNFNYVGKPTVKLLVEHVYNI